MLLSAPTVYFDGDAIARGVAQQSSKKRVLKRGGDYYFYVNISRRDNLKSNPPQLGFDLRKRPEDICFYVTGSGKFGLSYKSKIATISKDDIQSALQTSQLNEEATR